MSDQSSNGHMHHALTLAVRGLGRVAPNPAVGCVIVKDGHVVGRGWTQPGGRPHAETVALKQAGEAARGATAYVTLEPCAHLGQTPPCADALIKAGVARVVAAVEDPDPRVHGGGFKMLRDAGIDVVTGALEKDAAHLNQGFFLRIKEKRPLVTIKLARSADRMTVGPDKWITGEEARRFGHLLRAQNDAILVGIGTALADDPMLDCRLPGLEDRSPMRVVLDTHLRLPESAKLVLTAAKIPTLVFTMAEGGEALRKYGVEVMRIVDDHSGKLDPWAITAILANRGVTRLLIEGGATVASAYLDIADRLEIFTAPLTLGKDGAGAWHDPVDFMRVSERSLGPDVLVSYARSA